MHLLPILLLLQSLHLRLPSLCDKLPDLLLTLHMRNLSTDLPKDHQRQSVRAVHLESVFRCQHRLFQLQRCMCHLYRLRKQPVLLMSPRKYSIRHHLSRLRPRTVPQLHLLPTLQRRLFCLHRSCHHAVLCLCLGLQPFAHPRLHSMLGQHLLQRGVWHMPILSLSLYSLHLDHHLHRLQLSLSKDQRGLLCPVHLRSVLLCCSGFGVRFLCFDLCHLLRTRYHPVQHLSFRENFDR